MTLQFSRELRYSQIVAEHSLYLCQQITRNAAHRGDHGRRRRTVGLGAELGERVAEYSQSAVSETSIARRAPTVFPP